MPRFLNKNGIKAGSCLGTSVRFISSSSTPAAAVLRSNDRDHDDNDNKTPTQKNSNDKNDKGVIESSKPSSDCTDIEQLSSTASCNTSKKSTKLNNGRTTTRRTNLQKDRSADIDCFVVDEEWDEVNNDDLFQFDYDDDDEHISTPSRYPFTSLVTTNNNDTTPTSSSNNKKTILVTQTANDHSSNNRIKDSTNIINENKEMSPNNKTMTRVTFGADVHFENKSSSTKMSRRKNSTRPRKTAKTSDATFNNASKSNSPVLSSSRRRAIVTPIIQRKTSYSTTNNLSHRRDESLDSTSAPVMHKQHLHPQNSSITNIMTNTHMPPSYNYCPPIPIRAIGIDTRMLQTFAGDAMANTYRNNIITLLCNCIKKGLFTSIPSSGLVLGVTTPKHIMNRIAPVSSNKPNKRKKINLTTSIIKGIESDTNVDSECVDKPVMVENGQVPHKPTVVVQKVPIETKALRLPFSSMKEYYKSNHDRYSNNGRDDPEKDEDSDLWSKMLPFVKINQPVNNHNDISDLDSSMGSNEFQLNKSLGAAESWKIYGDLVEVMITEIAQSVNSNDLSTRGPVDLTIFCNDISLFTDKNIEAHKRGLARFWDRLRTHFQSNLVQHVTLMVLEFGIGVMSTTPQNSDSPTSHNSVVETVTPNRFQTAQIMNTLHQLITKLSEDEYKKSDLQQREQGLPIDFKIEIMDCHPIFLQSIFENWSHEVIDHLSGGCHRIRFDLPETLEGIQCSISLDLSFVTLPYRLDSPIILEKIEEMKMLGDCRIEVLKVIPSSSVDPSLIYGMPLSAKAGLEDDINQYKEMVTLISSLWEYLGRNDVALVLRCISKDIYDYCSRIDDFSYFYEETKYFILMAEEESDIKDESKTISSSPNSKQTESTRAFSSGILYSYVNEPSSLLKMETDGKVEADAALLNSDDVGISQVKSSYSLYIERSLSFLSTESMNPFLKDDECDETHSKTVLISDSSKNKVSDILLSPGLENGKEEEDDLYYQEFHSEDGVNKAAMEVDVDELESKNVDKHGDDLRDDNDMDHFNGISSFLFGLDDS